LEGIADIYGQTASCRLTHKSSFIEGLQWKSSLRVHVSTGFKKLSPIDSFTHSLARRKVPTLFSGHNRSDRAASLAFDLKNPRSCSGCGDFFHLQAAFELVQQPGRDIGFGAGKASKEFSSSGIPASRPAPCLESPQ
jgi:hypothetical protein